MRAPSDLITYMRTDSTRISDQARDAAREFIVAEYGEAFHGGRRYAVREGAQDAHEAIRPTSVFTRPSASRATSNVKSFVFTR